MKEKITTQIKLTKKNGDYAIIPLNSLFSFLEENKGKYELSTMRAMIVERKTN